MTKSELIFVLELNGCKIYKGVYKIEKEFVFRPRIKMTPIWATKAMRVNDNDIGIGHLVYDDSGLNRIIPKFYPWEDENRMKYREQLSFSLRNHKEIENILKILGLIPLKK